MNSGENRLRSKHKKISRASFSIPKEIFYVRIFRNDSIRQAKMLLLQTPLTFIWVNAECATGLQHSSLHDPRGIAKSTHQQEQKYAH